MARPVLFHDVRIFDGQRTVAADSVHVCGADGLITAVGHGLPVPPGAEVVDGQGTMTLLPGLIDAHFHLLGEDPLRQALTFGTTTVLSMGDDPVEVARLKRSTAPIADIRSAGVSAKAPGSRDTAGAGIKVPTVAGPQDAARFVEARIADGSDYIKIRYDDGDLLSSVAGRKLPFVSKETMTAVVDQAHRHGLKTLVHIGTLQAAHDALDAGVDGLAHVFVDRGPDDLIARRAASLGTFVVPTLNVFELISGGSSWRGKLASDNRIEKYLRTEDLAVAEYSGHQGCVPVDNLGAAAAVRAFLAAGVPLLAGSDPTTFLHGVALWRELELLVSAGLPVLSALAAATSVPAGVFGLSDRGRIAPGLRADLILVDGDPTSDIGRMRNLVGVWQRGEPVERVRPPRAAASEAPIVIAHDNAVLASRGSGFLAQTGIGEQGDFVLVTVVGGALVHFQRANDEFGYPWRRLADVPLDALGAAVGPVPGGVEAVVRLRDGDLVSIRWGVDGWSDPVRVCGSVTGNPALVVSASGQWDLLVPSGDQLLHYQRPGGAWVLAGSVHCDVTPVAVSASLTADGLAAVVRGDRLVSLRYGVDGWSAPVLFGGVVTGDPALAADNLVVLSGDRLVHYRWTGLWTEQGALPADFSARRPTAVGMIDSSFGNIELVVVFDDDVMLPFYLNSDNGTWMTLPAITDGQRVFGDLGIWEAVARQKFAGSRR